MNTRKKRIFAWVMAILMTLMFVVPTFSLVANAEDDYTEEKDQISDLNEQYKQLQEEQQKIQGEINKASSEKKKQMAISQQLGGQIENTTAQIGVLERRIDLLEDSIATKEKEMAAKQKEIDENYDLFKQRFRAMCSTPEASTLGLVLGADNFSQFLTRTEVSTRIAQYDQSMIDMLTAEMQELNEIKEQIEADKLSVESDKGALNGKKQELAAQQAQTQKQIQDISAMEQQFLANKAEMQKEMKAVQAQIDAIYAEINRNSQMSKYIGGEMEWPVPSLSQITSSYGYRFNGSDFHTGIDISGGGAYGKSIIASNTGTVAFVKTTASSGYSGGYGKYLIIDHGGGITTLYAHCSDILVNVGDVVSRGETIAKVGNTGWSTGPHLHYEVRINGKHNNPMNYLGK